MVSRSLLNIILSIGSLRDLSSREPDAADKGHLIDEQDMVRTFDLLDAAAESLQGYTGILSQNKVCL